MNKVIFKLKHNTHAINQRMICKCSKFNLYTFTTWTKYNHYTKASKYGNSLKILKQNTQTILKQKNKVNRKEFYLNRPLEEVLWGIQPQNLSLYGLAKLGEAREVGKGWRRKGQAKHQGRGSKPRRRKG